MEEQKSWDKIDMARMIAEEKHDKRTIDTQRLYHIQSNPRKLWEQHSI